MILDAFFRTLGQIGDPRFRRVLFLGVGLTLALLVGATLGFLGLVQWLTASSVSLPLIGPVTWLDDVFSIGSVILMMFLSVFLMVPVASAITSLFLDEVAQAVEDRHFPHLPEAAAIPIWEAVKDTMNFLGILIGANILALILYVMFPPAAPFIFWALNGFLLGREYFTLAASRRVGPVEARKMCRRYRGTIWGAGILMAMPLSIPLVNLVIPILGAATFTHLFHALWRQG
ncbi:EI24 domain-containing protein [Pseudophaeobacter flagellatus]|uniref:EI24 domain-containing protein n=1 Tax=Pseudophaeobacter flagellatus TaxID=2899119 RepID=UPI001E2BFFE7|nr:EI24 domain-containing protein [Pseudophaeobacter flagellatus]MCD9149515.1 EI24 domain-containing protein [Pseudophaeobacter flagellatus]